jgi:hypothetical protein
MPINISTFNFSTDMKIVVLGSTNTDMVITGKKIPVPGETVSGGTFLMNPGAQSSVPFRREISS